MIIRVIVAISMLAMYGIGEWTLQTNIMYDLKHKYWWQENCGYKKNEHDYKSVILMHSIIWSACTIAPLLVLYYNYSHCTDMMAIKLLLTFLANVFIHAYVDNLYTNKDKINLVEKHFFHFLQLAVTYLIFL